MTEEPIVKPAEDAAVAAAPPISRVLTSHVLPRVLLAALPVASLGLLSPVPSLVIAVRRGARADWLAFAAFTAVTMAWILQIAFTPEETHGFQFAADLLLLLLATAGAAVHCLLAWPSAETARSAE
ncbi:hypothetical protein NLX86_21520 [Streptomyces sp. A3M-1-3]|uniref:hypothetical protein n=1 Tax=Streptomyces sp. A3M-1-3 TaxID=2962044 RepID=UPI0020B6F1B5|nr:hypothetical protein [Streptomyces sp. A3M-1-3]MCP3820580.1 hypothetical protein [Streptomyces sp. A3M-1-3]